MGPKLRASYCLFRNTSRPNSDPEVRMVSNLATQVEESCPNHFKMSRLERFFDWLKAKRAIALCLRFKQQLKNRGTAKVSQCNKAPRTWND